MRRYIIFISFLTLSFLLRLDAHSERRKIGLAALLPLTGSAADQGVRNQRGLLVAAEQMKKEFDIDLQFEDTHGDPKLAVDAFRSIQSRTKLDAVFTWGSGVAMALMPIGNTAQIV